MGERSGLTSELSVRSSLSLRFGISMVEFMMALWSASWACWNSFTSLSVTCHRRQGHNIYSKCIYILYIYHIYSYLQHTVYTIALPWRWRWRYYGLSYYMRNQRHLTGVISNLWNRHYDVEETGGIDEITSIMSLSELMNPQWIIEWVPMKSSQNFTKFYIIIQSLLFIIVHLFNRSVKSEADFHNSFFFCIDFPLYTFMLSLAMRSAC